MHQHIANAADSRYERKLLSDKFYLLGECILALVTTSICVAPGLTAVQSSVLSEYCIGGELLRLISTCNTPPPSLGADDYVEVNSEALVTEIDGDFILPREGIA
jgi:hypothetical protein